MLGGAGDDRLNFNLADRVIDGGVDRAALVGSDLGLIRNDFDAMTSNDFMALRNVEIIDIAVSGDNNIQLNVRDGFKRIECNVGTKRLSDPASLECSTSFVASQVEIGAKNYRSASSMYSNLRAGAPFEGNDIFRAK